MLIVRDMEESAVKTVLCIQGNRRGEAIGEAAPPMLDDRAVEC